MFLTINRIFYVRLLGYKINCKFAALGFMDTPLNGLMSMDVILMKKPCYLANDTRFVKV